VTTAPGVAPDAAWFARVGLPLASSETHDARAYLVALGYPGDTALQGVSTWKQAEAVARNPSWDRTWWAREDAERERLMDAAALHFGRVPLLERLSAATELAGQTIHRAACAAAQRAGVSNAALVRVASGAAALALHTATLARLAGAGPDHLFMRKYALVESGRWPLGIVAGAFYLF
jgi:hypothetical protein